MDIKRTIRRQLQYVLGPTLGLSLSAYFAYHLVEGERGLFAWSHLIRELHDAQDRAAAMRTERKDEEKRIAMLRSDQLDPDLLDQEARRALNLVGANEVVIQDPSEDGTK